MGLILVKLDPFMGEKLKTGVNGVEVLQSEVVREIDFTKNHARGMLRILRDFLYAEGDFNSLSPFYLSLVGRLHSNMGTGYGCAYFIGYKDTGKDAYLPIRIPVERRDNPPSGVYVMPNSHSGGEKPYYWLDLYEEDPATQIDSIPLAACRLNPDDPKNKVDYKHWHNIGEQLLADYIEGVNGIKFENLEPFTISPKSLWVYQLGVRPNLRIGMGENPILKDANKIVFKPRQVVDSRYQYLEAFIPPLDENSTPVAAYRLFPESKTLSGSRKLSGITPEKQILGEYLSGIPGIKHQDLLPIKARIGDGTSITLCTVDDKQVNFWFKKGVINPGEEVVFIPRQDDQNLYEWMEVQKLDPATGKPTGKIVGTSRLVKSGLFQSSWNGPELQLLREYGERALSFDNLRPIPLRRRKTDVLTLWREGNTKTYLTLSLKFGLTEGSELLLSPLREAGSNLEFLLTAGERRLARYSYDTLKQKFFTLEILYTGENDSEGKISSDEANKWLRNLLQEN